MKIGIAGFSGSGKSTVFHWLTGVAPDPSRSQQGQIGKPEVPDDRLDWLSSIFKPKKHTPSKVEFLDTDPPMFDGLQEAVYIGDGSSVKLNWDYGTDNVSYPIQYNVYHSEVSGGQDFDAPITTTLSNETVVSYLDPGVTHYFVVRAQDSRGNEETNTVEIQPDDTVPPVFNGIAGAVDTMNGGQVQITWEA